MFRGGRDVAQELSLASEGHEGDASFQERGFIDVISPGGGGDDELQVLQSLDDGGRQRNLHGGVEKDVCRLQFPVEIVGDRGCLLDGAVRAEGFGPEDLGSSHRGTRNGERRLEETAASGH